MHCSCILNARQILKTEDNKKSDSSKVNEVGRNFKATFFEDREIFQAVLHFSNYSLSPFPAFFTTILQVFRLVLGFSSLLGITSSLIVSLACGSVKVRF